MCALISLLHGIAACLKWIIAISVRAMRASFLHG